MDAEPKSVFLIDDHPIVEAGLRLGFGLTDEFKLVGVALEHKSAIDSIRAATPDVIISDLVIDGEVEFYYLTLYREIAPNARLIAFSSLSEELYGDKCLAAGADGFVSKSTSPHELVSKLKTILLSPRCAVSSGMPEHPAALAAFDGVKLTPREMEVAQQLGQGQSVVQIGERLGISKKTVGIHRDNLRLKLNCATSNELVVLLVRTMKTGGC